MEKAFVRRVDPEVDHEEVGLQMRRHVAVNDKKAVYRMIVAAAADVNAVPDKSVQPDSEGLSLLHVACQSADLGMAELLLQYGANVNAVDRKGHTALHLCAIEGKSELARLFLSRYAFPLLVFVSIFLDFTQCVCAGAPIRGQRTDKGKARQRRGPSMMKISC